MSPIISGAGSGSGGGGAGSSSLVYRFAVSGSVKASIDTGVDVAQAGSGVFSGGDVLEIFLSARTDEAAVASSVGLVINNDSTAHYAVQQLADANVTLSQDSSGVSDMTTTKVFGLVSGGTATANFSGSWYITIPNYAGTTFFKAGVALCVAPDTTTTSARQELWNIGWPNTAAITRLKVVPVSGNLAVGSTLAIYKRTNA